MISAEPLSWPELDVASLPEDFASGVYRLRFGAITVPVKFRRGTGDILVVVFHGSVDRSKRLIPHYQSLLTELDACHQLSVADPTLELHPEMSAGWYLGGAELPLEAGFPGLIACLSERLAVWRRIYTGGSSGGFAALNFSRHDPGSVCIAVNPQTDLATYHGKAAERQLRRVWPDAVSIAEIGKLVTINLSTAYAGGFDNLVIYLQSLGDLRHYGTQMATFSTVGLQRPEQFILHCGYWGIPGHSGSIPLKAYRAWVRAVVAAPWFDRQGIIDSHYALTARPEDTTPHPRAVRPGHSTANPRDLRIVALLRAHHLSQPIEGLT